jgi:hypothetical protein
VFAAHAILIPPIRSESVLSEELAAYKDRVRRDGPGIQSNTLQVISDRVLFSIKCHKTNAVLEIHYVITACPLDVKSRLLGPANPKQHKNEFLRSSLLLLHTASNCVHIYFTAKMLFFSLIPE